MINKNIQIMRAISLLMVFLFHLNVKMFNFGYLGVDIFFIISGFLMPMIISKYTPYTYIKARAVRLYPALSFVILISLIIGYFLSMPGEYKSLAESALSSLMFSSNYYFLFNTGYFNLDSKLQLLLHTWSLGNEFLGYILIFLAWVVFKKDNLKLTCYVLCIASFLYVIANNNISYLDPIPRLYLFFFAFIISDTYRNKDINDNLLLFISGFTLALTLYFFGLPIVNLQWPNIGILFLPLVICPLLLLKKCIIPIKKIQSIFVHMGDWSYSIYLWHWLVISSEFIFLRNTVIYSFEEAVILFVPGFLLGVLSYFFIERNKKLCIVTTLLSVVLAGFIYWSDGIESRVDPIVLPYSNLQKMTGVDYIDSVKINNSKLYLSVVQLTNENAGGVLVIGDSFSQHILPMMKASDKYKNNNIYRLDAQPHTVTNNWNAINATITNLDIKHVLISYSLMTIKHEDIVALTPLLNGNKNYATLVIRDIPSLKKDPVSCFIKQHSKLLFQGCEFNIDNGIPINMLENNNDSNWRYLNTHKQAYKTLDTHAKLCDNKTCKTMINNEFIMRDTIHFNEKLSRDVNHKIGELFFTQ